MTTEVPAGEDEPPGSRVDLPRLLSGLTSAKLDLPVLIGLSLVAAMVEHYPASSVLQLVSLITTCMVVHRLLDRFLPLPR